MAGGGNQTCAMIVSSRPDSRTSAVLDTLRTYFSPFAPCGALKDVSRGTLAERAAAFRHNCTNRGCLATYIQRWLVMGTVALLLTGFFDALAPGDGAVLSLPVVLAACVAFCATLAACAVFILSYAYAALSYHAAHFRD
jgi:hypothetical protein